MFAVDVGAVRVVGATGEQKEGALQRVSSPHLKGPHASPYPYSHTLLATHFPGCTHACLHPLTQPTCSESSLRLPHNTPA